MTKLIDDKIIAVVVILIILAAGMVLSGGELFQVAGGGNCNTEQQMLDSRGKTISCSSVLECENFLKTKNAPDATISSMKLSCKNSVCFGFYASCIGGGDSFG